jgi:hypothetical protein
MRAPQRTRSPFGTISKGSPRISAARRGDLRAFTTLDEPLTDPTSAKRQWQRRALLRYEVLPIQGIVHQQVRTEIKLLQ